MTLGNQSLLEIPNPSSILSMKRDEARYHLL